MNTGSPDPLVNHAPIIRDLPELEGQTVVITGGASGMGTVFLRELARRGVNGIGGDLDGERMASVAASINAELADVEGSGRVVGTGADVTDPSAHDKLVNTALDEFGRMDMWVNNAGIFSEAAFTDISSQSVALMYGVNVNGVIFGGQAAARHFQTVGGGVIVNIASIGAEVTQPNRAVYNSSKAAVAHLTECMALDLGPANIRVNAIAPGQVDTEMFRIQEGYAQLKQDAADQVPLRRVGAPVEVFGALSFLLSDSARYVNGAILPVDGGVRLVW
ncbi:SDR family NAD(P)-dependent oxidoreductase [Paenarthrobacter nicotinovorans]|uniref:SDR family NAD(P)-dependent oxidoreductase n=1 Tax=Paenarthrobacter nicotinovorans TaxID=29320 RepID=UPI0037FAE620